MKAVLGLEDGTYVVGDGFGKEGVTCGELVFATPTTGYEEALTDPSYKGQILLFTYPLIGNYGVNKASFQSSGIKAEGLVIRERCDHPSHNLSTRNLSQFLDDENASGICEVDTRMLTIRIRTAGTMRAAMIVGSDDGEKACELARKWQFPKDIVNQVTCRQPYEIPGNGPRVVVMDFGVKRSIVDNLAHRGAHTIVVPATTSAEQVMGYQPDAILLSNGPGDPENATNGIAVAKKLAGQLPIFGICLGHQIASLALGASTYKLKFGHRGANQPVIDLETGKVYITSQNHGYAVDPASIDGRDIKITHVNANDGTVEGMKNDALKVWSVQYHPEANPGPQDTNWFFDSMLQRIGGHHA
ncbi:glutamine-hydrolyzing carbamoyl-phosphate synthase small subunit [Methanocella arvoryzae]|uniref:Carbamoyl phosphate synthase small chain n=1 Tax=Methanocella arvoryzae (strain DSM 22066 / NBRC 105507 / MRE50) TaxID=351160 RepID=Q0W4P4_METAR|nr:glutamine-hydrolyzing carbamoyl-phosphate synthase small subunit [Methanocella arvoryzae]CAJ36649.1 carbamoyl-phosphate synthase, small subunit [Methanocella arvoryzae MRE50]